jgi:succinoglycan biosynthesis transport protein ExoP
VEQSESTVRDLRQYLSVLRQRRIVIVFAVLVLVITTLSAAELQVPRYQATAQVLLQYRTAAQSVLNPASGQPADPTREVQNQLQVIQSQPVKQAVRNQLGYAPTVVAIPVGQTDVIDITADNTDPVAASTIANTYANAYISYRQSQAVANALAAASQVQGQINQLQTEISALNTQIQTANPKNLADVTASVSPQLLSLTQQQGTLKEQLSQLQSDAALNSGDAQLVNRATVPNTPASPRPARDLVIAVVAGLILGVGAALLLDQLDDSVKSPDDIGRVAHGVPNLAVIPFVAGWKSKDQTMVVSTIDPKAPAAEAYRSLRTSVQFAALDRPLRTLHVTSPSPSEGKTTTLTNLGVALAQVGQRVIIVCCDLRRPRLHEFFGMSNELGFTSVLLGHVPAANALQDVPGVKGLKILPSGPLPPNPSELLSSPRAAEVLVALQGLADFVLVDSPPVIPVTDAAVLSGLVDATLVVATAGLTTRRQLRQAIETLEQVDAPILGTVLNRVGSGDSYGYGRYRYYRYERQAGRRWRLASEAGAPRQRPRTPRVDVNPQHSAREQESEVLHRR